MGYRIQERIIDAFEDGWTPLEVSRMMKVDIQDVNYVIQNYLSDESPYDDSMDGDFDSAMLSAGFGMDEDYLEGDYL
jgi:hypothetical protein|tara:strand:+ start:444 stop:674 length:231 start_codon:yes stop_codon:yes gene_type:complete